MKRLMTAGLIVAACGAAMGQVRTPAAGAEPEQVQMLRIEMRKALLGVDASVKVGQARAAKVKFLQEEKAAGRDASELANAEVELIEAQATEQVSNLAVKSLEAQLNDLIKNAASLQPRQPASATEITVLQLEVQKAKVQADAAAKVWQNRQGVLQQAQSRGKTAAQIADAQADMESSRANAGLLALDVEAAQVRLDSAMRARR